MSAKVLIVKTSDNMVMLDVTELWLNVFAQSYWENPSKISEFTNRSVQNTDTT
jgi:hypothetical protein